MNIDTVKPVAKAEAASVVHNRSETLELYIAKHPEGCGKAKVTIAFYQGTRLKRTFTTNWLSVNKWDKVAWKCTLAKGTYTMKVSAKDVIRQRADEGDYRETGREVGCSNKHPTASVVRCLADD